MRVVWLVLAVKVLALTVKAVLAAHHWARHTLAQVTFCFRYFPITTNVLLGICSDPIIHHTSTGTTKNILVPQHERINGHPY